MIARTQSLAMLALVALPSTVFAQPHGGGGRPGGGGGAPMARPAAPMPAPAMRPAAPAMRPAAPAMRPAAPAMRPAAPAGGFNFNHDIAPQQARPAPVARPAMPVRSQTTTTYARPSSRGASGNTVRPMPVAQRPVGGMHPAATGHFGNHAPEAGGTHVAYHRAPATQGATGGAYHGHFNGHPIGNEHVHGNWGWNRGRAWYPASGYWGGGFWGDFALATLAGAGIYGYIDDSQDGYVYDSYQVEPDTPGAELLNDYGLQQTACGPPGLVDIWGPDGSIICAAPNDTVPPGDYQVDPETFTLVPATT